MKKHRVFALLFVLVSAYIDSAHAAYKWVCFDTSGKQFVSFNADTITVRSGNIGASSFDPVRFDGTDLNWENTRDEPFEAYEKEDIAIYKVNSWKRAKWIFDRTSFSYTLKLFKNRARSTKFGNLVDIPAEMDINDRNTLTQVNLSCSSIYFTPDM